MNNFNKSTEWVPQARGPHGQVLVRGVEIWILRPGKIRHFTVRLTAAVSLLILSGSLSPAQQSKPWEQIPVPPLHAFHPQQPKRIELKNGIVIFLQEDHELPFIYGSVLVPGGSRDEDPAKAGLVRLYSQAWRTSGTASIRRRRHGRPARIESRAH